MNKKSILLTLSLLSVGLNHAFGEAKKDPRAQEVLTAQAETMRRNLLIEYKTASPERKKAIVKQLEDLRKFPAPPEVVPSTNNSAGTP